MEQFNAHKAARATLIGGASIAALCGIAAVVEEAPVALIPAAVAATVASFGALWLVVASAFEHALRQARSK